MFLMYIVIPNNECLATKLNICHFGCAKRDEGGYEFIYFVSSFQFHLCVTSLDPILEWYHAVAVRGMKLFNRNLGGWEFGRRGL